MTLLNLKLFLYLYLRNSNSPTSVGWHIHIEKIAPDKNDTKHARSQSNKCERFERYIFDVCRYK